MPIIQVHHLFLRRKGIAVLHDISFDVDPGETLIIIGPSGSGKSSLLRCLNRLNDWEKGTIMLNGVDTKTLPVIDLRCKVGMIFQKVAPFEGTVRDNIAYGPRIRGQSLSEDRVLELLELASLEVGLIHKDAHALSGGQEQRLAIARALANEPDVLLLDEPTSSLDPIATRHVEESMHRLKSQLGLTQVWVSHTIEQARRVADRVLLLDAGRVIRVDSVDAMLDPETGDKRALAFASGREDEI